MGPFWTPEREEDLRQRFDRGETARTISRDYGVSRPTICGKLDRMGLKREIDGRRSQRRPKTIGNISLPPRPLKPIVPIKTAPLLLEIHELRPDSCRYIIGDPRSPAHRYCGLTSKPGQSWCPEHCDRVFGRMA
ncbi:MAG: hypothetical protein GC155_06080 [Alphaproteobacteria bacterium]|nr:hypothetical protein [Alphaproteobacteria bacterium]